MKIDTNENKIVFVSEKGDNKFQLYIDGEKETGIRRLNISAGFDEIVMHDVEYCTCKVERSD